MTAIPNDAELRRQRLVFYEEDIQSIDACLARFLEKSKASATLLIDIDGHLVTKAGFTSKLDTNAIAALVAGCFASTRALAQNLGEKEFSVIFHQGENENIHISLVASRCLLVIIFDDRTTIGMVRLHAKDVTDELSRILEGIRAKGTQRPSPIESDSFVSEAQSRLDTFFDEKSA